MCLSIPTGIASSSWQHSETTALVLQNAFTFLASQHEESMIGLVNGQQRGDSFSRVHGAAVDVDRVFSDDFEQLPLDCF